VKPLRGFGSSSEAFVLWISRRPDGPRGREEDKRTAVSVEEIR